jgi:hypothetical protein
MRNSPLDPNAGSCKEKVVPGATLAGVRTTKCDSIPSNFKSAYERYRNTIATAVEVNDLDAKMGRSDALALVAAVISQESGWNERAQPGDGGTSFGLMQVRVDKHPECASIGDVKNDYVANIKCGTKILADLSRRDGINTPREYACLGVHYSGTDAILRYYNGWPPGMVSGRDNPDKCKGDPQYVNSVRTGRGHLEDWTDCFKNVKTP